MLCQNGASHGCDGSCKGAFKVAYRIQAKTGSTPRPRVWPQHISSLLSDVTAQKALLTPGCMKVGMNFIEISEEAVAANPVAVEQMLASALFVGLDILERERDGLTEYMQKYQPETD